MKQQKGFIDPLSLIGLGFLLTSLIALVTTASNPIKKQLISTWARYNPDAVIRQRERTGECKGKYCLAPEVIQKSQKGSQLSVSEQEIVNTYNKALQGDKIALDRLYASNINLYNQALAQIKAQQPPPITSNVVTRQDYEECLKNNTPAECQSILQRIGEEIITPAGQKECTPGEKVISGPNSIRICSASGTWGVTICQYGIGNGECKSAPKEPPPQEKRPPTEPLPAPTPIVGRCASLLTCPAGYIKVEGMYGYCSCEKKEAVKCPAPSCSGQVLETCSIQGGQLSYSKKLCEFGCDKGACKTAPSPTKIPTPTPPPPAPPPPAPPLLAGKPDNSPCSVNSDCQSGNCQAFPGGVKRCVPAGFSAEEAFKSVVKKKDGEACPSGKNSECESGVCGAGYCLAINQVPLDYFVQQQTGLSADTPLANVLAQDPIMTATLNQKQIDLVNSCLSQGKSQTECNNLAQNIYQETASKGDTCITYKKLNNPGISITKAEEECNAERGNALLVAATTYGAYSALQAVPSAISTLQTSVTKTLTNPTTIKTLAGLNLLDDATTYAMCVFGKVQDACAYVASTITNPMPGVGIVASIDDFKNIVFNPAKSFDDLAAFGKSILKLPETPAGYGLPTNLADFDLSPSLSTRVSDDIQRLLSTSRTWAGNALGQAEATRNWLGWRVDLTDISIPQTPRLTLNLTDERAVGTMISISPTGEIDINPLTMQAQKSKLQTILNAPQTWSGVEGIPDDLTLQLTPTTPLQTGAKETAGNVSTRAWNRFWNEPQVPGNEATIRSNLFKDARTYIQEKGFWKWLTGPTPEEAPGFSLENLVKEEPAAARSPTLVERLIKDDQGWLPWVGGLGGGAVTIAAVEKFVGFETIADTVKDWWKNLFTPKTESETQPQSETFNPPPPQLPAGEQAPKPFDQTIPEMPREISADIGRSKGNSIPPERITALISQDSTVYDPIKISYFLTDAARQFNPQPNDTGQEFRQFFEKKIKDSHYAYLLDDTDFQYALQQLEWDYGRQPRVRGVPVLQPTQCVSWDVVTQAIPGMEKAAKIDGYNLKPDAENVFADINTYLKENPATRKALPVEEAIFKRNDKIVYPAGPNTAYRFTTANDIRSGDAYFIYGANHTGRILQVFNSPLGRIFVAAEANRNKDGLPNIYVITEKEFESIIGPLKTTVFLRDNQALDGTLPITVVPSELVQAINQ